MTSPPTPLAGEQWAGFTPSTNARITLLATALNNLGVAAIVAGIVAPMVNGTVGDPAPICSRWRK
jgi:hypothetical protein